VTYCRDEEYFTCESKGTDADGNKFEDDCSENFQDKAFWESVREDEFWNDKMDENWDFYHYWDLYHGSGDLIEDDENYSSDDLEEFWENADGEEFCDGWCEWEYSDANNWDEDWSDEEKEAYWAEKARITGCDAEKICEFLDCNDDEFSEGDGECWREECYSDCGEYTCSVWHFDEESQQWYLSECAEEYNLGADLAMQAQAAAEFAESYDDTFEKAA
jgi:hypothetical protein